MAEETATAETQDKKGDEASELARTQEELKQTRGALIKERSTSKQLAQQLKAYEVDGKLLDMADFTKAQQELAELRDFRDNHDKGETERMAAIKRTTESQYTQRVQALEKENAELKTAREQSDKSLHRFKVETRLRDAAVKAKVRREFLDDVALRVDRFTILEDEVDPAKSLVLLDPNGEPVRSLKTGGNVTADEFFQDAAIEKPGWFEGNSGGGGGAGSSRTVGGMPIVSRSDPASILANLDKMADGKAVVRD